MKERGGSGDLPQACKPLIDGLFAEIKGNCWSSTRGEFEQALHRSAAKHFAGVQVTPDKLEEYLSTLHSKDLALACACANGHAKAWDYFVSEYREYLRCAAAAILRCAQGSPAACELADSLFAELYGLSEDKRSERSLFRYFHGRSSLKTWLRAVLAQRHVDGIRAGRRFSSLTEEDADSQEGKGPLPIARVALPADPHRERYLSLFTQTLEWALGLLEPRDRERLRLYYAEEQTLAEIGRRFGEHESSVSRNLERTRRELRQVVEEELRKGTGRVDGHAGAGLSEAEISLCFEYAAEEAPIDLAKLLPADAKKKTRTEGRET